MVMKFQRTSAAVGITLIGRAVPDIFEWIVEQSIMVALFTSASFPFLV